MPTEAETQSAELAQVAPAAPAAETLTVDEQLAKLPTWEQAALRAEYKWPQGLLLPASEFQKARDDVRKQVIK